MDAKPKRVIVTLTSALHSRMRWVQGCRFWWWCVCGGGYIPIPQHTLFNRRVQAPDIFRWKGFLHLGFGCSLNGCYNREKRLYACMEQVWASIRSGGGNTAHVEEEGKYCTDMDGFERRCEHNGADNTNNSKSITNIIFICISWFCQFTSWNPPANTSFAVKQYTALPF